MEELLKSILNDSFSLTQINHRVRVLKEQLIKSFFGSDTTVSPDDLAWLNTIPQQSFQIVNKQNIYEIFDQIAEAVKDIQVLTLYLPFEWNDASISEIGARAREEFKIGLLLDVKYDPNLIAGCAIVWEGIYKDYSLRTKIDAQKQQILEGFRQFLQ